MQQPVAYLNGRLLPAHEASVPFSDAGFVLGVTVTEQLRTFGGKLFRLDAHLDRLAHSLAIVGVEPMQDRRELAATALELVGRNHALVDPDDDLGLGILATPGPYGSFEAYGAAGPLVGMYTYPLAFARWAEKYERGARLVVTPVEQVGEHCWPRELKCRSRMHYYLADRQAHEIDPGAHALLCDAQGHVLETATANVMIHFRGSGLVSPPIDKILPGISRAMLIDLAHTLGIAYQERDLTPDDVARAHEVLLASTPYCLLPVTAFQSQPVGDGRPGDVFRALMSAWDREVGCDIERQARTFARRPT